MVIPHKSWCHEKGYIKNYNNQGTQIVECDFESALLNAEVNLVITEIGEMFQKERGFELALLGAELNQLKLAAAQEQALGENTSIKSSAIDKVNQRVKPDIILELYYKVHSSGVKKSIEFRLTAIDAYTSKQIGNANGIGEESFETNPSKLLLEAIHSNVTNLANQMQSHFDDQLLNGREISMSVRVFDSDFELDSEINGVSYQDIIEEWMSNNTVNKSFKMEATTTQIQLIEVRIPMYDERGKPIDASMFSKGLQKLLKEKTNLNVKRQDWGIGMVWLIIGNNK